jgi:hypothetical protein
VKGSHISGKEKADSPGGGPPDCVAVIVAKARGRAPAGQASCQKTPRLAKEGDSTRKRMHMTKVEKLKIDLEDLKKQKGVRGVKEKAEKVANPDDKGGKETQQSMKGTRNNGKKTTTTEKNTENDTNINATTCQRVSAISPREVQK